MPVNETGTITLRLLAQDLASGNVSKFVGHIDAIAKKGGLMGSVLQGVGQSFGQMLNPIGLVTQGLGAVTTYLTDAAKAASEEEAAISKLTTAIGENDQAWRGNIDAVEKVITRRQALAFTDGEQRESVSRLVSVTGDLNAALDLSRQAMDLARLKQMSLVDASELLGKVYGGNVGILSRYGIQLRKGATVAEALGEIQKRTAGQAEAFAETTAGAFQTIDIAMGELQEEIGMALLPTIKDLALGLKDLFGVLGAGDKDAKDWARSIGEMKLEAQAASDPLVSLRDGVQALNDILQPQVDEAADFAKEIGKWAGPLGVSERAIMDMFLALKDGAGMGSEGAKQAIRGYVDTLQYAETSTQSFGSVLLATLGPGGRVVRGVSKGTDQVTNQIGDLGIRLRTSMASWRDEFEQDWKDLAAAIKNPFSPKKLANTLEEYADKAAKNAARAARNNKPNVARRWREVADVMKTPVLQGLVEIGLGVDDAVNAILLVQQMGQTFRGAMSPLRDALGNLWGNKNGGVNADGSPNRHAGGPVMAGRTYTVGGPGAEERLTLYPGGGGHVTPMQGGRGGGVVVNLTLNGLVGLPSEADIDRMGRQLEPVIRRAMAGAA
jgi:hypothetical protein